MLPVVRTRTLSISPLVGDSQTLYLDLSNAKYLTIGSIGGLTLAPGLYKWSSGVNIASDVTILGTLLGSMYTFPELLVIPS